MAVSAFGKTPVHNKAPVPAAKLEVGRIAMKDSLIIDAEKRLRCNPGRHRLDGPVRKGHSCERTNLATNLSTQRAQEIPCM